MSRNYKRQPSSDVTGRSGTNPPGGRPGSRQSTPFAELTTSTDSHDPYWYYEPVFDTDDDDYDYDDEDPSSAHIEDPITSFPRQLRYSQPPQPSPPPGYGQLGNNARSSTTSSSPIPHAQDPITYQSPPGFERRVRRQRGVARQPRADLSSIPEESASTAFPYTIQGPGQRIVHPLPPIPAGPGQQDQARGLAAQRIEEGSKMCLSLPLRRKEKKKEDGKGAQGENQQGK